MACSQAESASVSERPYEQRTCLSSLPRASLPESEGLPSDLFELSQVVTLAEPLGFDSGGIYLADGSLQFLFELSHFAWSLGGWRT